MLGSKFSKLVFLQILNHSSVSWDITPLYFLAEILYTFNKKSLLKYKFCEIESLKFGTFMAPFDFLLMGLFVQRIKGLSYRNTEELFMTLNSDGNSQHENWHVVWKMTQEILPFFVWAAESLEICTVMCSFCQII